MFAETAERWFTPLERFAALHAGVARRSTAEVIDLSYPNYVVQRDTRGFDALRAALAGTGQESLQYTPFGGRTIPRRLIASALAKRVGVPFGFRDVALTPGATSALGVAFAALFRPGDEVLMVTPSWMDYPLYLEALGVTVVPVPSGTAKRLDVAAIAGACGPRTAGLILSQPACPTGVLHHEAELISLAAVLARADRRIVLISDEVHRDQVWADAPFVSPLRFHPHAVSVYSFGKAWSMQGQRTGYLALGTGLREPATYRAVERALRAGGHCAPTALMQEFAGRVAGLTPCAEALRADQEQFRALLRAAGLEVIPGEGTAFVYARCPAGLDDWAMTERFAAHGVLVMPSSVFHEPGHIRFALNAGPDRFDEISRRLRAALGL
ncbi:MAG TPA: pyridoxal phosphate-dependent aminotransferase [Actinoplanes sp.]|jgi:aspartate aminotransferase